MNIDQLKVMLELQALQNFGGNSTPSDSGLGSVFTSIMNEMMASDEAPGGQESAETGRETFLSGKMAAALPPVSFTKLSGGNGNLFQISSMRQQSCTSFLPSSSTLSSNRNPTSIPVLSVLPGLPG